MSWFCYHYFVIPTILELLRRRQSLLSFFTRLSSFDQVRLITSFPQIVFSLPQKSIGGYSEKYCSCFSGHGSFLFYLLRIMLLHAVTVLWIMLWQRNHGLSLGIPGNSSLLEANGGWIPISMQLSFLSVCHPPTQNNSEQWKAINSIYIYLPKSSLSFFYLVLVKSS